MAKQINETKLGILGGGQLGRMLIQEAINYDLTTYVLDDDKDAPCKAYADKFINGPITDFDAVYEFGKMVDVLTVEIEQVNIEALEQLENEGKTVYPQPRVLRLIQDKALQKQFFKQNDIPTAPFQLVNDAEELKQLAIPYPYILKTRKDGYDGKGVMVIRNDHDRDAAFNVPCIAEQKIDFVKEIAVIVARNDDGDTETFPMVDMEFNTEANLVEFLVSPSEFSLELQEAAKRIAIHIATSLKIVGLLAVEMFVTEDGTILVNELAPRPHNSGHHTIEANYTSQFGQHLRAILGLPLGSTKSISNAVMINVLGGAGHEGRTSYKGLKGVLEKERVYLHLYGKKYTKPFRKMGHITVLNDNRDEAIATARTIQKEFSVESR